MESFSTFNSNYVTSPTLCPLYDIYIKKYARFCLDLTREYDLINYLTLKADITVT